MKIGTISLLILFSLLFGCITRAQNYTLPNNNAGCPSNCRQIPWVAGSDLWSSGTLPVYAQVTCTPLNEDGSTDDSTNIQNCINAANAGNGSYSTCHAAGGCAVFLPAGNIFINNQVRLKSNVVVRGAGPTTFILEGANCANANNSCLDTQNFSTSGNLNPTTSFNTIPSTFGFTNASGGAPQKGDTTIKTTSGTVAVGTWIKVFGNDDPTLISDPGGSCNYCGDNTGAYLMQQFVQVTGFVSGSGAPGSVANISQPLDYTPYTTAVTISNPAGTEPAGAKYNIITFGTQKAGYEYFHVVGQGDLTSALIIQLQGCLFCWVKGVETQYSGSNSNGGHIRMIWTYGAEIRDNYVHEQRYGGSGAGYGIDSEWANGNAKIENNIVRHSRHGIIWEGGGGDDAVLYNYVDDNFTDDTTYLGSARPNHGAHPHMQLWEGNIISHIADDDLHGSSSHRVSYRNNYWGDETNDNGGCSFNNGTTVVTTSGTFPLCTVVPQFIANVGSHSVLGFAAIDIFDGNNYMSFVANVLGRTGMHANWTAATLRADSGSCCIGTDNAPYVYAIATTVMGSTPVPNSTVLLQGNWDFKTNGIAFNDGGTGFTYAPSLYYTSKPAFLGSRSWPLIGSDVTGGNLSGTSGKVNTNAAYDCYWTGGVHANQPFNPTSCYPTSTPVATFTPTSPINFGQVQVGTNKIIGVTLQNTGAANLVVSTVSLGSVVFALINNTCGSPSTITNGIPGTGFTLTPGQSCTFNASYTPATIGSNDLVSVFFSPGANNPDQLQLNGQAIARIAPTGPALTIFSGITVTNGVSNEAH